MPNKDKHRRLATHPQLNKPKYYDYLTTEDWREALHARFDKLLDKVEEVSQWDEIKQIKSLSDTKSKQYKDLLTNIQGKVSFCDKRTQTAVMIAVFLILMLYCNL